MQREWDHMWTRVWHIGGRLADLPQPATMWSTIFAASRCYWSGKKDGGVRAFYNVCQHRGNKLVWNDGGSVGAFTCAYHGWRYRLTGTLCYARDPENFAKGDPSGKIGAEGTALRYLGRVRLVQHGPQGGASRSLPRPYSSIAQEPRPSTK